MITFLMTLQKRLQEQKDAQAKIMLKELKQEVSAKEELIKIQLAREIQRLQEDKLKIENDIPGMCLFFQVITSFFLFVASKCKFWEFP
jgi:hypothetical protein